MNMTSKQWATEGLAHRQACFQFALDQAQCLFNERKGIGTLNEKSVHALLKNFYAPYVAHQEVQVAGYVADIMQGAHIMEIQTRHFRNLRKKLDAFLPLYDVTIIYPIAHTKWVHWIHPETGEVLSRRKSPKKGSLYTIIPELYQIKDYLTHPHLHFILPLLEVDEYKLLNGWSRDKKRGAEKQDTYPRQLVDEVYILQPADYKQLLPETLPPLFTSKDYQKATRLPVRHASTGLNILYHLQLVERVGKKGNAFLYERCLEKEKKQPSVID